MTKQQSRGLPMTTDLSAPSSRTLPTLEQLLLAAWQLEPPVGGYGTRLGPFPKGFWPNIARRALEWERVGYSAEDLEAEVELAKAQARTQRQPQPVDVSEIEI